MTYIAHHGILGMKWGIRRYQNKDGSLTEEGKKRYGIGEEYDPDRPTPEQDLARHNRRVKTAKNVAVITGATAVTALIVSPKARAAVGNALKKIGGTKNEVKDVGKKIGEGVKEGIKEGIVDAPKTAAKMLTFGLVSLGLKEVTDIVLGKDTADRAYKANNKKKLSNPNYWQGLKEDNSKDDDDD